ncbi:MAG TPA: DNA polymerase III subunit beta [Burkholderiaceae bacterium]|nr:DNA polymerase III subunit beta [Burkholderiaceae bacterium]
MLFMKADRDAILKPLSTVAGIVERRHTLPILANVLLRKQGPTVSFLASDVEIQVQTSAELGAGDEDAATTVSARKLIDLLRALPEGVEVSLKLDDKRATLQAGRSRFALQTLGADDFPTVNVSEQFNATFELPQKQLKHLFHMVHFAMAQQDIRYYLNGLLLVTDGEHVRVVATDGHRLAYCHAQIEGAALSRHEVIVPRKTVLELQRLLADSDDPVRIEVASNQVRFTFGEVQMISKLVEGKFPDYQRVIPSGYTRQLACSREALGSSLARASILTSDKFKGVRLGLAPGSLRIQTSNAEQEEAVEELEVDYANEPMEIGFNVGYLQDVLANLKTEQVQIGFGDANTSALLTVPGNEDFRYVVMPMRI